MEQLTQRYPDDFEDWVAHAEGAREQAEQLMRAAADGEDGSGTHVAMENCGRQERSQEGAPWS
jgi:hypothetical protein